MMIAVEMRIQPVRRPAGARGSGLRLNPNQGPPRCVLEQFVQHVRAHKMLWWIAVMTTLSVLLQIGLGDRLNEWIFH